MKLFLDAGHGGSDSGAVSGGLIEKILNLITMLMVKVVLEAHGIQVKCSRLKDMTLSLAERTKMANEWGADYFVSIHYNAGGGDGAEAIHSVFAGKGLALAQSIVNAINKYTGQNLRPRATYSKVGNNKRDYFAVIRETKMTAIIVECGFLDSPDRVLFDTKDEQENMGKAIAYGILNFLGIAIKQESPKEEYGIVTADMLNVRTGRGTSYSKIGQLKGGTKVKLCYLKDGWYSIDYGPTVGYVSADYIRKV